MCQLLGLNCNRPTDATFSFSGFTRRGGLTDAVIRRALAVKPLWAVAKGQARRSMIQRAESPSWISISPSIWRPSWPRPALTR